MWLFPMEQQQNSFYSFYIYLLEIPVSAQVGISYSSFNLFYVCLIFYDDPTIEMAANDLREKFKYVKVFMLKQVTSLTSR